MITALIGGGVLFFKPEDPALAEARKACKSLAEFEEGIEKNFPARDVLNSLSEAETHAKQAASDSTWISLLGGIQSIKAALNADDPGAAQVGIGVTRTECRKTTET
jgi:hypothetical protein